MIYSEHTTRLFKGCNVKQDKKNMNKEMESSLESERDSTENGLFPLLEHVTYTILNATCF